MMQGYYAGISGIQTHQYALDVIADNLANTGTTGFRSGSTEFADLLSATLSSSEANGPTTDDIGLGVKLQTTSYSFAQGDLMQTDRYTDLALEGNGWFGTVDKDKTYFTRDGHFTFDAYQRVPGDPTSATSRLVTADGMIVTGTMLNNFAFDPAFDYGDLASNGTSGAYVINQPASTLSLSDVATQTALEFPARLSYPAEPTTQLNFLGNLGSDNVVRAMNGQVINAKNETNRIHLVYTLSATQPAIGSSWDIVATAESKDGTTVYDTQSGQATFDGAGGLTSFNIPPIDNNGSPVSISLGDGFAGVVATGALPISGGAQGDGLAGGIMTGYKINNDGIILAEFTNGRESAIGRVAVYHFQNDQGLNRDGGSYFTESGNSGKPLFWKDANGNTVTGAIVRSGNLEASNARVDVGLTDMIVMQRAYQANAKTITTVDEMIQKALQMHK